MLDVAFIRDNLDAVKANSATATSRPTSTASSQLDDERKRLVQETQVMQQRGERDRQIDRQGEGPGQEAGADRGGQASCARRSPALDAQVKQVEADLQGGPADHPEHDAPDAPVGDDAGGQQGHHDLGRAAEVRFPPKDHVALAEALDLVDFEAGAAVAGQKFYFLKNEAVLLELALVQYAMQTLRRAGYTPVITPDLARVEVLEGIGFMPRDRTRRRSSLHDRRHATCA